MIPEFLGNWEHYEEESYDEMTNRYRGFGENFYPLLKERLPPIFTNLIFYKANQSTGIWVIDGAQILDSYAIFRNDINSFAIQLEPLSPVICIWNWEIQVEIGDWSENPEDDALNHLIEYFEKK